MPIWRSVLSATKLISAPFCFNSFDSHKVLEYWGMPKIVCGNNDLEESEGDVEEELRSTRIRPKS
jgi:hypothetical protein